LRRTVAALEAAKIPYAVAVEMPWRPGFLASMKPPFAHTGRGHPITPQRLPAATEALNKAGFIYRHAKGLDMFLDGPTAKARDAVHIVFAAEKVKAESLMASPDINESEVTDSFRLVTLDALVRMNLRLFATRTALTCAILLMWGSWIPPG